MSDFNVTEQSQQNINLQKMPQGLSIVRDIIVMNDDEAIMLFDADSIETTQPASPPAFDIKAVSP